MADPRVRVVMACDATQATEVLTAAALSVDELAWIDEDTRAERTADAADRGVDDLGENQ